MLLALAPTAQLKDKLKEALKTTGMKDKGGQQRPR